MTNRPSTPPDYFEALYSADADPWDFATSSYERQKYQATLQALPQDRYGRALEIGCSIGVLTDLLAPRVDALLALDVDQKTLERAAARNAHHGHVRFERRVVPADWPKDSFDLIVLSEVLYFLSPDDVVETAVRACTDLAPGGCIALVNWTGPTNYPCGGDQAAELFVATAPHLQHRHRREAEYRLDVLTKPGTAPLG